MNNPKLLDERQRELRFKLRADPRVVVPEFTKQEMLEAAGRLLSKYLPA